MDSDILLAITKMRAKRKRLLELADKLSATITSLEEIFGEAADNGETMSLFEESGDAGDEPSHSPTLQNSNIPGPYAGMTIHDAAIKVLRAFGTPLKTRFIADELTNGGLTSSGMYRAVYNSLSLSEQAKLHDKQWQLRTWEN